MTSFLHYVPSVPFDTDFGAGNPSWPSLSSLPFDNPSTQSINTIQRHDTGRVSVDSFLTASSLNALRADTYENFRSSPRGVHSQSTGNLLEEVSNGPSLRQASGLVPHKFSLGADLLAVRSNTSPCLLAEARIGADANNDISYGKLARSNEKELNQAFSNDVNLGFSFDLTPSERSSYSRSEIFEELDDLAEHSANDSKLPKVIVNNNSFHFKKWVRTFRRRNLGVSKSLPSRKTEFEQDEFGAVPLQDENYLATSGTRRHQQSSSVASSGIISAVKTASISLASFSAAPRSRRPTFSSQRRSMNPSRSSNQQRASVDSSRVLSGTGFDEAAWDRSIQRRKILDEILSSEESYVSDMKALMGLYYNLLASTPTLSSQICSSIRQTLAELLQLHEDLLHQLYRVMPNFDFTNKGNQTALLRGVIKHTRWRSVEFADNRAERRGTHHHRGRSLDHGHSSKKVSHLTAEPQEAALLAGIFDKMLTKFFLYEEYGAEYEQLVHEVAAAKSNIPSWHDCEMGIEALAKSVASMNSYDTAKRKGLTFCDLIIKPIQRICKYPLLFADLLRQTPVIDCPESHVEVEKVLCRLRETAQEIDKAANNTETRDKIHRTWLLQDRLTTGDENAQTSSLRSLGYVHLCGVLHIAYQTRVRVTGEYMLCALYKSYLLLATPNKGLPDFKMFIKIRLQHVKLEAPDNGRGLQCHTAPFSWKVYFVSDNRLYELLMTACSLEEEQTWTKSLLDRSVADGNNQVDDSSLILDDFSASSADLKPIAQVYGQSIPMARRISMKRAATVGVKVNTTQVVIRNTSAAQNREPSLSMSPSISRSQSLLSTNRVTVLAPKRSDRIRLEAALEDVWTMDALPYPGMNTSRTDHLIRASANSVMRKISLASISTPFAKRSTSQWTIGLSEDFERKETSMDSLKKRQAQKEKYRTLPTLMDSILPEKDLSTIQTTLGFIEPPPRTSSAMGTGSQEIKETRADRKSSRVAFTRQAFHPRARSKSDAQQRQWMKKRRLSASGGLLKAISADGLKNLFHHPPQT
ncbi:MAG: hypothetical protein M1834_007711 [Cirrosporium novae-zelandiae]|nr:MAG: hypothetical protein M1834_007711 [Cirrosporium novae-zelandiae]